LWEVARIAGWFEVRRGKLTGAAAQGLRHDYRGLAVRAMDNRAGTALIIQGTTAFRTVKFLESAHQAPSNNHLIPIQRIATGKKTKLTSERCSVENVDVPRDTCVAVTVRYSGKAPLTARRKAPPGSEVALPR